MPKRAISGRPSRGLGMARLMMAANGGTKMARFRPTLDIWELDETERSQLQPGQWVTAGPDGPRGRFYGEGRSTVVAWLGNARGRYRSYMATLRDYGRSIRGAA